MKTKKIKKPKRTNINRGVLIEQVTERLYSLTNQELFGIANITHKPANFSVEKHRLISRI